MGSPEAPAALCIDRDVRRHARLASVYRLLDGRPQTAWQATIDPAGEGENWLALIPVLSADGQTLELRERWAGECEDVICQYQEKQLLGLDQRFGSVLDAACEGVGTYAFSAGHFVLNERTPRRSPKRLPTGGLDCH